MTDNTQAPTTNQVSTPSQPGQPSMPNVPPKPELSPQQQAMNAVVFKMQMFAKFQKDLEALLTGYEDDASNATGIARMKITEAGFWANACFTGELQKMSRANAEAAQKAAKELSKAPAAGSQSPAPDATSSAPSDSSTVNPV